MSGNKIGTYEMRPYEIAAIDRYLNRTVLDFATAARPIKPLKYVDMANAVRNFRPSTLFPSWQMTNH